MRERNSSRQTQLHKANYLDAIGGNNNDILQPSLTITAIGQSLQDVIQRARKFTGFQGFRSSGIYRKGFQGFTGYTGFQGFEILGFRKCWFGRKGSSRIYWLYRIPKDSKGFTGRGFQGFAGYTGGFQGFQGFTGFKGSVGSGEKELKGFTGFKFGLYWIPRFPWIPGIYWFPGFSRFSRFSRIRKTRI